MNYADLLSSYISNSNLSLSQISDALKLKGFSTDKGYISKLQNGKIPPAGEELNRALAEITGGDAEKLIMAGYMEKAPDEVKEILERAENIQSMMNSIFSKITEMISDEDGYIKEPFKEALINKINPTLDSKNVKISVSDFGFGSPTPKDLEKMIGLLNFVISMDEPLNRYPTIKESEETETKITVAGQNIELSPEEIIVFEEMKKHPKFAVMFHDLAKNPEKKVKALIKMWEALKATLEEDDNDRDDIIDD